MYTQLVMQNICFVLSLDEHIIHNDEESYTQPQMMFSHLALVCGPVPFYPADKAALHFNIFETLL